LQKLLGPKVCGKPKNFVTSAPAQESFHGISGMYDFAELKSALFLVFQ
jgi:hypothetical protein